MIGNFIICESFQMYVNKTCNEIYEILEQLVDIQIVNFNKNGVFNVAIFIESNIFCRVNFF